MARYENEKKREKKVSSCIGVGEVKNIVSVSGRVERFLMSFNVIELKRSSQAIVLLCLERRETGRERKAWVVKKERIHGEKHEFHLLRDLVPLRKFRKSFPAVEEHDADDTCGIARKITRGAWSKRTNDFCICYHETCMMYLQNRW